MSVTQQDSLDLMYGIAKGAIDANAPGILHYAPDVRYVGQPKAERPDQEKLWIRISSSVVTDDLSAIPNATGQKLYQASGLLSVELYCPRNVAGSVSTFGLPLGEAIRSAYRSSGSSGEISFTNQKIVQMTETDESYLILVSVRFTYQTVQ